MWIFFIVILVLIITIIALGTKIVEQSQVYIIERFGKFHKMAEPGITFVFPFIERVVAIVSLKKQLMDIEPQQVITKDNVNISVDNVIFYQITDPVKSVYEISNITTGIRNIAISNIRNIIGKMELDETFNARDIVNKELSKVLNSEVEKWGCTIERVEIQKIIIPQDVREAMEKQVTAERSKRARVLEAEASKHATVLDAEGKKQEAILRAEAEKEANIRLAEGKAEAMKKIAEAESKQIELVYGAMKRNEPTEKIVQIKALETLGEASKGSANKIFIPFEATKTLSGVGAIADMFTDKRNVSSSVKSNKVSKEDKLDEITENTNLENEKEDEKLSKEELKEIERKKKAKEAFDEAFNIKNEGE